MEPRAKIKSVVITGASTGIGAACALHLDALGFRVFAGVRKLADAEALKAMSAAQLTPVRLDVTDSISIKETAELVAAAVGESGLLGLVNNAGIAVAGPLEVLPIAEFRKQLEINVIGQIAVTQAFLPLLRKGRGRIINMGSIAGRTTLPFLGAYSASKFALEALTDALRLEVDPWGISVSIIEPGAIATPIWEKSEKAGDQSLNSLSDEAKSLYLPQLMSVRKVIAQAEQRAIPAEVVARAVAHALMSARPKTRYLVGRDAKFRAILKAWLPDRVQDTLMKWFLGLPQRL